VAAPTLAAVGALVAIIFAVARNAERRGLGPAGLLVMALCAREPGVPTRECKGGLLGVIEAPLRPVIGRVAALALAAEDAAMYVVGAMTIDALGGRAVECERGVALCAVDQAVHPDQGISAQVVIEGNAATPLLLTVATLAAALEGTSVWILTAMAGLTGRAEFLLRGRRGMTCIAGDARMGAYERKLMAPQMVVRSTRLPVIVIVAVGALNAEPVRMHVIGTMTAKTILRYLLLVVAAAMAGEAIECVVHTQQRKAGLLEMVVLGALPLAGGVAAPAIGSTRAPVLIVGGMTAVTARRS